MYEKIRELVHSLNKEPIEPLYFQTWEQTGKEGFLYLLDQIKTTQLDYSSVPNGLRVLHRLTKQAYFAGRSDLILLVCDLTKSDNKTIRSIASRILVLEAYLSETNPALYSSLLTRERIGPLLTSVLEKGIEPIDQANFIERFIKHQIANPASQNEIW